MARYRRQNKLPAGSGNGRERSGEDAAEDSEIAAEKKLVDAIGKAYAVYGADAILWALTGAGAAMKNLSENTRSHILTEWAIVDDPANQKQIEQISEAVGEIDNDLMETSEDWVAVVNAINLFPDSPLTAAEDDGGGEDDDEGDDDDGGDEGEEWKKG